MAQRRERSWLQAALIDAVRSVGDDIAARRGDSKDLVRVIDIGLIFLPCFIFFLILLFDACFVISFFFFFVSLNRCTGNVSGSGGGRVG